MMSIEFNCQSCRKTILVRDEFAGLAGKCSSCGAGMVVPPRTHLIGPMPSRLAQDAASFQPNEPKAAKKSNRQGMAGTLDAVKLGMLVAGLAVLTGVVILFSGRKGPRLDEQDLDPGARLVRVKKTEVNQEALRKMQLAPPVTASAPTAVPPMSREVAPKAVETPADAATLPVEKIVAKSQASVAIVRGADSSGSGFLVLSGIVATNARVIRSSRAEDIRVLFTAAAAGQRGPYRAEVIYFDLAKDLALLSVASNLPPLDFDGRKRVRLGQDVVFIGNPVVGGLIMPEIVAGQGVIGQGVTMEGQGLYQISGPITVGNSGGPVLDLQGRVIGMATARVRKNDGLGYCIPAPDLAVAVELASTLDEQGRRAAAARHAQAVRVATGTASPSLAKEGSSPASGVANTVLAPDFSYRPKVGDKAAVLRHKTPAATSQRVLDDFAVKEMTGDTAGMANDLEAGLIVMVPRWVDVEITEVQEPPQVENRKDNTKAIAKFNEDHPAGGVVGAKFLYGPQEGGVYYIARLEVGRFKSVARDSREGKQSMEFVNRRPLPKRPGLDRAVQAAAAMAKAEALEEARKFAEATESYRQIIRAYPGSKAATTAQVKIDAIAARTGKR